MSLPVVDMSSVQGIMVTSTAQAALRHDIRFPLHMNWMIARHQSDFMNKGIIIEHKHTAYY